MIKNVCMYVVSSKLYYKVSLHFISLEILYFLTVKVSILVTAKKKRPQLCYRLKRLKNETREQGNNDQ